MIEGMAPGAAAARRLAALGRAEIGPGLTEAELAGAQRQWGFEFADDHRDFLLAGLPMGPGWPDWRTGDPETLRAWLDRPGAGVLFEVEHNGYWHPSWGRRPADPAAVPAAAEHRLAGVPRMIPVYSHRYLPAGPGAAGHPVLSIHQTDVIHYGADLADYIDREFGGPSPLPYRGPRATVEFWKDFLD